jgi:hypothetical protein
VGTLTEYGFDKCFQFRTVADNTGELLVTNRYSADGGKEMRGSIRRSLAPEETEIKRNKRTAEGRKKMKWFPNEKSRNKTYRIAIIYPVHENGSRAVRRLNIKYYCLVGSDAYYANLMSDTVCCLWRRYSTFLVRVPSDVISLQLCIPTVVCV